MSSPRALHWRAVAPLLALSAAACSYDYDAPFRCSNGELDGDETDLDCGGSCDGCGLARACIKNTDCAFGACRKGVCGYEPVRYWSAMGTGPAGRWGAAFAQVGDGSLVLWSGIDDNLPQTPPYNDTWVLEDGKWTNKTVSPSPPGQGYAPMALDRTLGRAVLYTIGGETWSYGARGWKKEGSGDLGRQQTFMAYDDVGKSMLLYGGLAPESVVKSDVVARSSEPGSHWITVADIPSGNGLWGVAGGFDVGRRELLAFGGKVGSATYSASVAEYDVSLASWSSVTAAMPQRWGAAAAYDEEREVLVVFGGGTDTALPAYHDVWEYGADGWHEFKPKGSPPPGLFFASMAYDAKHHRIVMYGGATILLMNQGSNKTYSYSVLATNCTSGDQCALKHCVDGVCCADAQCADGFACNLPENPGFCTAMPP